MFSNKKTSLTSNRRSQLMALKQNYFEKALAKGGFVLNTDESPYIITKEQSLVIRDIETYMKEDPNYPNNATEFINGLQTLCSDDEAYRKALFPTTLEKPTANADENVEQDSLFRILLNINCIQTELIEMLLMKVMSQSSDPEDTSLLRLILNAFRYLPFIKDPKHLRTKLLDLVEISSLPSQAEILDYIPDIIPDNQYDATAEQLSKILEDNEDLAGAIIDCLNSFSISAECRFNIQELIMEQLLSSTRYYKIFPILFEFLVTDCKQENLINTLLKTRKTMESIMSSSDKYLDIKVMVFKKLEALVRTRRNLFEGFISMVNTVKVSAEHKPVDLLLMFLLHSVGTLKKKLVEVTFKKRVKAGLFKVGLFERFFEKMLVHQFFKDCFESMIEIAGGLLQQHNDVVLVECGVVIYKLIFRHGLCSRIQRQDVLHSLILLMGTSDARNATAVLEVIGDFLEEPKLREHVPQLMGLLERLEKLSLKDVKKVFEILCRLTCREDSDESQSGFRDDIHMLIRKQLSLFKKDAKHRGIVSAIVMTKHIITTLSDEAAFSDQSYNDISDLPNGPGKNAARLLEMTFKSAATMPELLGLYYDEISSLILATPHIDKHFLSWLYDTITHDFQNAFVIEIEPVQINDIPISSQYSLHPDMEESISVNIAELAIKARNSEDNTILMLAPVFHLLRLLHHKQSEGDLGSIDALLGCGIAMPVSQDFDNLDTDQLKNIADCIFHCINWFREVISAFVTQPPKRIRIKVMKRLMDLIQLEQLLNDCMEHIPDHKLPVSYFDQITQNSKCSPMKIDNRTTKKPPRKKLKSNPIINESVASTSMLPTQPKASQNKRTGFKLDTNYKFRELDTDVILLLKYPLYNHDSSSLSENQQTQQTTLHLKQFQFLLKDFVNKLNVLTKHKNLGLLHLNMVDPVNLIKDCCKLLPFINKHISIIENQLKTLLEENDGRYDVPELFTIEANDFKIILALYMDFIAMIFGWSGFQHAKHDNLLYDCLKSFQPRTSSQAIISINRAITDFVNKLHATTEQCLCLHTAVCIVNIMKSIYQLHSTPELSKMIVTTSEKLLTKKWFTLQNKPETGKTAWSNIESLVKAYLGGANIKTLCGLVGTLQEEISKLVSKEDSLHMLGSIDRANFHVFYRGLCTALSDRVKSEVTSLTNSEHLVLWRTTALTMQGLMTVVKVHETRANFSCFLKKSIEILKVFLTHGIPILEMTMKSKPDEVVEIFKIMQTSTRFLHHLCCYSKTIKDSSLMALVPQFKYVLETLVYRVKAALVANNCSQAFWMGNLRNRDLQGEDILSQSTVGTVDETEELSAEESEDEIVDDLNDKADSEVFD